MVLIGVHINDKNVKRPKEQVKGELRSKDTLKLVDILLLLMHSAV